MDRKRYLGALLLAVAACSIVAGCNSRQDAANTPIVSTNPAKTAPPGVTASKQGNNATPDVDVYPAPAGVKTGIEGGKK